MADEIIGNPESTQCLVIPNISEITDIFPSFTEIHKAMTDIFQIPFDVYESMGLDSPPFDLMPKFPDLPSFPSMDWSMGSIKWPSVSAGYAALGMYIGQLFQVLDKACSTIFNFIGNIPFPKLPEFNLDLSDFLKFDPIGLIEAEYEKIKNGILNSYDALMSFLPLNITPWPSLSIPIVEAVTSIQNAASAYLGMMITFLTDILNNVLDFFQLPISVPTMPKLPSVTEIMLQLYDKAKAQFGELVDDASALTEDIINGVASQYDTIKAYTHDVTTMVNNAGANIVDLFSQLSFPDFSFSIPSPLFPTFSIPDIEITHCITAMASQMYSSVVKKLTDFMDALSQFLGVIKWPTLSDLMPDMPDIPPICSDDMPPNLVT